MCSGRCGFSVKVCCARCLQSEGACCGRVWLQYEGMLLGVWLWSEGVLWEGVASVSRYVVRGVWLWSEGACCGRVWLQYEGMLWVCGEVWLHGEEGVMRGCGFGVRGRVVGGCGLSMKVCCGGCEGVLWGGVASW